MGQLLLFSKEPRGADTHELTHDEVNYIVSLLERSQKALAKRDKLLKQTSFEEIYRQVLTLHHVKELGPQSHLGMLVRMVDKLIRACQLAQQPAHLQDGSLEDILLDLANYTVLAILSLRSKKGTSLKY